MLSDRLLQSALASTPIWSDGAVEFARRWVLPHLRARQATRRLTGTSREGGTARVLVVGATSKLDHDSLGLGFFGEPPMVEDLAPIAGYGLLRRLEAELDRHDLVLTRVWVAFAGGPKRTFVTMPEQPDMRVPAGSREAMFARATATMRREIRIAERHGFTLAQTTDDASFECFYHDYHVPFVQARHGDGAVIHADATLRRRLRRGALTSVALAGERLYASAFEIMGDTLREHVVGSLHGRVDDLVRSAAYVARVDHIRRAHAAGLRWMNMGGVAPWLSDGSAIHKRSWGGELVDRYTSHRVLLVGWRRWTPAIARFLATYPILVRRTWGFGAIVAADNDTPAARAAAHKVWHRLSPRGLRRLAVVGAGGAVGSLWSLDGGLTEWAFPRPISSADLVRTLDRTDSA